MGVPAARRLPPGPGAPGGRGTLYEARLSRLEGGEPRGRGEYFGDRRGCRAPSEGPDLLLARPGSSSQTARRPDGRTRGEAPGVRLRRRPQSSPAASSLCASVAWVRPRVPARDRAAGLFGNRVTANEKKLSQKRESGPTPFRASGRPVRVPALAGRRGGRLESALAGASLVQAEILQNSDDLGLSDVQLFANLLRGLVGEAHFNYGFASR